MKKITKLLVLPILLLCLLVGTVACSKSNTQLGEELLGTWYYDMGGLARLEMTFKDGGSGEYAVSAMGQTETVPFEWKVETAGTVNITFDYNDIPDGAELNGDINYSLSQSGKTLTLTDPDSGVGFRMTKLGEYPEDPDQNLDQDLIGTWKGVVYSNGGTDVDYYVAITFVEDGSGVFGQGDQEDALEEVEFTWNVISDGVLQMMSIQGIVGQVKYSISGNKLILSGLMGDEPITFSKQ